MSVYIIIHYLSPNNMHISIITWRDNSEREISLRSAKAVAKACTALWHDHTLYDFPSQINNFLQNYKQTDFVFVMIHGSGGEDGQIPAFLDTLWLSYQCTTLDVLQLTINKWLTKQVWKYHQIPIATDTLLDLTNKTQHNFDTPCVLKALDQWSSVGVKICHTADQFHDAIESLRPYWTIMMEELLVWSECTVPILDDKNWWTPHVLPIVEIIPPEWWIFDYENKYNDMTQEIVPARYDEATTREIQDIALRAYQALWCTSYGRIDMILTADGPKCLEINTIPGFTASSLFPKSAEVFWLSFPELVQHLIQINLQNEHIW